MTPIRIGAGMRNKVIHAMACGAPLVSASRALEGVPDDAVRHVTVADDTDAFADAVVRILDDPAEATKRASAAVESVRSLSTPAVADRFEAWWRGVAAAR